MLLELVRQARQRLIFNDLFSHGANAFSAALIAFILMLLMGTQVLDWHWAVAIPIAAVAYGVYLTWNRRPGLYRVAQIIDRRLQLADTLSTGLYYSDANHRGRVPDEILRCQLAQAERLCPAVDLRLAIPYRIPRATYAVAALLLVASSLFALRYGLSRNLDLRAPLARIVHQSLGGSEPSKQASAPRKDPVRSPDVLDQMGMSVSDREAADRLDAAPENAADTGEIPDVDNSNAVQAKSTTKGKGEEGDEIASGEPGDESNESGAEGEEGADGEQGSGASKDGQPSAKEQSGSSEKNSLMDKFKEAMRNLMSKMKQQPQGAGQQQSSQMAQNNKQGKNQQGSGKQNGSQGQKQRNSGQDADAQEGEAGEEAQSDQDAQSRGAGQNGEQQADKQPGSGIGKQDGDKDLKLAEQMAAMGKLSEIIGKRSANVTGEAMIEVKNTSQQLSTRYEAKRANHGESGAEISRDEVPIALQGYVQQYFEQVRKTGKK